MARDLAYCLVCVRTAVPCPPPRGTPSQTNGSGTLKLATWNIRSSRNGGLESACRAMGLMNVNIAFMQDETKLTGGIYTRYTSEYLVLAMDAPSTHQEVWLCLGRITMIALRLRARKCGDTT